MEPFSPRTRIGLRVLVAHAVGLWIMGTAGTIGTTAGFDLAGGALGLLLGGILSVPWLVTLAAVIFFAAKWIDRFPWALALAGPPIVCASWFLIGAPFLGGVALSCLTSSVAYLAMTYWGQLAARTARRPQV